LHYERYCLPPGYPEAHETPETITEYGIVGKRGNVDVEIPSKYFNHMSATRVRNLLGQDIWEAYTKLCVVRNPYDKIVSWFWYKLETSVRQEISEKGFWFARDVFRHFVLNALNFPEDRQVHTIDNTPCLDVYIRYENLESDLVKLEKRLGLDQPIVMADYNRATRMFPDKSFHAYYDDESASVVFNAYKQDFEDFDYDKEAWRGWLSRSVTIGFRRFFCGCTQRRWMHWKA